MHRRQISTGELIVGILLGLIVLGVAVYWMYLASVGALPPQIGPGLPNNLVVNLIILVVLTAVLWAAFQRVRRS